MKKKKQFKAQINRLSESNEITHVLEYLCSESNKLYNCATYLARQIYFKTGKITHKFFLVNEMVNNPHKKALHSVPAQQTCISVGEAFKGYRELLSKFFTGELKNKPKLPKYRKKGLFQAIYTKQSLKLTPKGVRIPLGLSCKAWFGLSEIHLPFPTNLDWGLVRELAIVPRAGYFDAVWVTEDINLKNKTPKINRNVLSIDHGVGNWLTCTSNKNQGDSFIVDGKKLKAVNQWYNKRIARIKKGKSQNFWCKFLDSITTKRNRQMRDAVNKAAKQVVDYSVKNGIGTIVFGWNKGQKDSINIGRKNNQQFVQIPTAKLKNRIEQLCNLNSIRFIENEESYTSKASALDLDTIPVYGEKPVGWKASGSRIKRGLYRSSAGIKFNADVNGSINIARKVENQYGFNFDPRGFTRGVLTMPRRLKFWENLKIVQS